MWYSPENFKCFLLIYCIWSIPNGQLTMAITLSANISHCQTSLFSAHLVHINIDIITFHKTRVIQLIDNSSQQSSGLLCIKALHTAQFIKAIFLCLYEWFIEKVPIYSYTNFCKPHCLQNSSYLWYLIKWSSHCDLKLCFLRIFQTKKMN